MDRQHGAPKCLKVQNNKEQYHFLMNRSSHAAKNIGNILKDGKVLTVEKLSR